MSKVSLIAKLTAAEGKESELEAALGALTAASDEEPGLEIYSVHADDDDPGIYYFFELYTDADAVSVHGKGDGMRAAMKAVGGCLASPPEVHRLRPVSAKGFEL